jgi:AbrB family looped-hinge helix DNA binding protein
MSSKGQVVIPEEIRSRLGFKAGTKLGVVGREDTLILKAIAEPSMDEFGKLISEARKQARRADMKRADIASAIVSVRASRK